MIVQKCLIFKNDNEIYFTQLGIWKNHIITMWPVLLLLDWLFSYDAKEKRKQKSYHLALNAIYNTNAGTHCKLLLRLGSIFHNGRQLRVGYVKHLYNLQF